MSAQLALSFGPRARRRVSSRAFAADVGMPSCSHGSCAVRAYARGLCQKHYRRSLRHGDSDHGRYAQSFVERLDWYAHPEPMSGCWLWTGPIDDKGYARITCARPGERRRNWQAHRLMFETKRGPIPHGLTLDHLCRVRCCVNPDHLDPVTVRENTLRGQALSAQAARRDCCIRGHAYDDRNTGRTSDGARRCRACDRDAHRRKFAALNKPKRPWRYIENIESAEANR